VNKELVEIERRTLKSKRVYDEANERLRQHLNPSKEKKSSIERLQQRILPKVNQLSIALHIHRIETIV
jgi:hypothetical protein